MRVLLVVGLLSARVFVLFGRIKQVRCRRADRADAWRLRRRFTGGIVLLQLAPRRSVEKEVSDQAAVLARVCRCQHTSAWRCIRCRRVHVAVWS